MNDIELVTFFEICYKNLDNFFKSENQNGWLKEWAEWVAIRWSNGIYFDTETIDSGYDYSEQPLKTNKKLKYECKTYVDFIYANTGESEATYCSGSGLKCKQYEALLRELFYNAAFAKINELAKQYKINLPLKYQEDINNCKDMSAVISSQIFSYKSDPKLYEAADKLLCDFGSLGCKVNEFGYLPECSFENNKGIIVEKHEKTWCSDLVLKEVEQLINGNITSNEK
jgi:hypothetical protein